MDDSIVLRDVEEVDKNTWLKLWEGYLVTQNAVGLKTEITERTWSRLTDPAMKDMGCLVAVDASDNIPVAFATYVISCNTWSLNPGMYLEDLYVDDNARNRGIGTGLIRRLEEICKERGYSRLFWYTEADNVGAQSVYNKIAKCTGQLIYKMSFT